MRRSYHPVERAVVQQTLRSRALCIQLGGAVGTLGAKRASVRHGLATRLQLGEARQWHDQRDELLRTMAELAIVTETVGKLVRDVSLLSQAEVGEMLESPPTKGEIAHTDASV